MEKPVFHERWLSVVALILVWINSPAHADCPAQSPCQCSEPTSIIDCNNKGLTRVPTFHTSSTRYHTLDLQGNQIKSIPEAAFKELGPDLTTIQLNHNIISSVHEKAFEGVESDILQLNLNGNQLDAMPEAIGELATLYALDVSGNPIPPDGLNDTTMRKIGDSLAFFTFGSSDLDKWPESVRHLVTLQVLNVTETSSAMYTLPIDAFHGFDQTLKTLAFANSGLISVPLVFSILPYLQKLEFNHNHKVGDAGLQLPLLNQTLLPFLESLALKDNSLTQFPDILKSLRSLNEVYLDGNDLRFVSAESVQTLGPSVSKLSLRNCSLLRPPGSLEGIDSLQILDLSYNNIHSIDENDLERLKNLKTLILTNNPLQYVSKHGFHDLDSLSQLYLDNTQLKTVPRAICNLDHLRLIELSQVNIDCTCDLAWFKQFYDTNAPLDVKGTCETIVLGIEAYLKTKIPTCPAVSSSFACSQLLG